MKRINRLFVVIGTVFLSILITGTAFSQSQPENRKEGAVCSTYITGIGCSHCAVSDPFLFSELVNKKKDLIIIEYEIFDDRKVNKKTQKEFYTNYLSDGPPRVPFFILGKEDKALGDNNILDYREKIEEYSSNKCPLPSGEKVEFKNLDLKNLPGEFKVWTKNRVLMSGEGSNNNLLRKLILSDNVPAALINSGFQRVEPVEVEISEGVIDFEHAVKLDGWRLQWNGAPAKVKRDFLGYIRDFSSWWFFLFVCVVLFILIFKAGKPKEELTFSKKRKIRFRTALVFISLIAIVGFFILAQKVNPNSLKITGSKLPLWLFTVFIAFIDGFNPCNIFVLSSLLIILISSSDSKLRLYLVALSFLFMVFLIYFLFMCAWINVFSWLDFVTPLRIGIAMLALVMGIINCKELIFFKKGVSLTIPEQQRGFLVQKMRKMREVIEKGSLPLLIVSSTGLAALASLVELPCTAGFPMIYTGILASRGLENKLFYYYGYIFLYNVIYVIPLLMIVSIFIYALRAKQITPSQVQLIKFVGGLIMIILGGILLINPELIGVSVG